MIHASEVKVVPKEIKKGIAYGQVVQDHILDEICKDLSVKIYTTKWTTILTSIKINAVTEQILNLYGYRITLVDHMGNVHLYDIDWN